MKTTIKILVIVLVLASFGFGIYTIVQSQEKKKLLEEIKVIISTLTSSYEKEVYFTYFDKFSNLSVKDLRIVKKYFNFNVNNANLTIEEKRQILFLVSKGYLPQGK